MIVWSLALATILSVGLIAPVAADFQDGVGAFERADYATAHREFLSLAEHGDRDAQFMLGRMYQLGVGVAQDDTEAFQWFHKAAERGHPRAPINLGFMYAYGVGTKLDRLRAYFWFSLAAMQGDPGAMNNRDDLARFLTPAELVEADRQVGDLWRETKVLTGEMDVAPDMATPVESAAPEAVTSEPAAELPAVTTTAPAPDPGAFRVQLGAFRVPDNAPAVWRRLRQSQSDLLGGLQHRVRRVDRGEQGVLHLLQVGPLADAEAAKALCDGLVERGVDCLVVKP